MQLYYTMLIWDGEKKFEIDSNDGDKSIIDDIQKVFKYYYMYLKKNNG